MASTSEVTFGSRLANAQTLVTHLQSFTTYVAQTPDQSVTNMQAVIANIKKKFKGIPISVDTYKSKVAEEAVKEGADIINIINFTDNNGKIHINTSNAIVEISSYSDYIIRVRVGKNELKKDFSYAFIA